MAELPEPLGLSRMQPSEPKASILLVDDNPANLLSLRAILEELGQNLVEAHSGEEALKRVRSEEFAVVLLDVLMPGMNGFETAKLIRDGDRSRHTPIIFLTAGDIDRSQFEKGYALGAVDFLVKPLLPVVLQAKVRGFVQLFQDKQRASHKADQLRLLVHGTTEYAIFMLDPHGRIVTWNAGAERIKQYRAEEIIGQHFSRFYPQEANDRGWPAHELKVAAAEGRFEDEGWRVRKDGSRFWANVVITALRNEHGDLQGFSKVTRDLTARKQAEEALRRSEERFRLLVEGVKDYAIFLLDPQGHVASWNPGAERIKGYKAEEIIGQHFSRFYPQEAVDRGWPAHELTVAKAEGRFEDEGWRVRKDGTLFWANVVITALHDEAGSFVGYSKITRDLTERKRSEENARRLVEQTTARRVAEGSARLIQEQRERLHVTLASIGDAVISTDAEGRVDFLNPVAVELVGWKAAEATGRNLEDVFQIVNEETRQPVDNPALRALRDGRIVGLANHTILISRDGTERPIDDSAAPIRDTQGNTLGSVLVFRDVSEQRRAERASRKNQEILQLVHKIGKIGHWEWNSLTDENKWSPEIEALYGLPPGGFEGGYQGWAKLIHPDDLPQAEKDVQRAFESGEYFSEFRVIWPDGSVHWLETRAHVFKDSEGRAVRIIGVNMDITERKHQEDRLRESEGRLAALVEAVPQLVWTARPDGEVDFANRRWYEYTGLTPEQTMGSGWAAAVHSDDRERTLAAWQASLQSGEPVEIEYRLRSADGQHRWQLVRGVPVKDGEGRVLKWFGTITDIHDHKRTEADRQKLVTLAENSTDFIGMCDLEGVPFYINRAGLEMVGLEGIENARRTPVREFFFPEDQPRIINEFFPSVLERGDGEIEVRFRHFKTGEALWMLYRVFSLTDPQGHRVGLATVSRDITQRRHLEDNLRQLAADLSEADRRKDEFLATLAHELRNPLAPIRNALQIIRLSSDRGAREQARTLMERQLVQMVRLVDDLMDVSRITRGKLELRKERVRLAAVVSSAVETSRPFIKEMGHELIVTLPKQPIIVDADLTRLAQVFMNLMNNAAKYSDRGGHIRLTAERQGSDVVVSVKDTGIGIDADQLPRIFELFTQVDRSLEKSQGGLGIGLSLVRRLVELHNGRIEARSEGPGKGSEFIVRLPVVDGVSRPQAAGGEEDQTIVKSSLRILIVDDNRDGADSLAMMLRVMGNDTRTAYDGQEGVDVAEEFRPDVLLLDIGLPKLNGYEACRRIREQAWGKCVTLIAVTGWGQDEDRCRSHDAGFDHHMVKPVDPQALMKMLSGLQALKA
jgi:PAS domain S-box-containing protein